MSPEKASPPARGPRASLEGWLWMALLAALAGALLAGVAWDGAGPRGVRILARWLLPWLVAFHLLLVGAIFALATVAARFAPATRRIRWQRGYGPALVAIAIALNGESLEASRRASMGGPWLWAALAAAALGILLTSEVIAAPRAWTRGVAVAAIVLGLGLLFSPPAGEDFPPPPAAAEGAGSGARLLVVGLDGADWRIIERLFARGELPNLQRLRDGGVWGPLRTFRPTASPLLWTTMATGFGPAVHGIEWHLVKRPRDRYQRIPRRPAEVRGLGVGIVPRLLERSGRIVASPPTSAERRVPAYWSISTHFGAPATVVNWWATWPAEPILGRIFSDRAYFWRWTVRGAPPVHRRLTFPEALYEELRGELVRPDEVTFDDARRFMDVDRAEFDRLMDLPYDHHELEAEFKYYYSMFATHRRVALRLMESERARGQDPADLLVLLRIVDYASHSSLRYSELVEDHLGSTPEELRRSGRAVTEAYRLADEALGDLLGRFGPGNVVVLSDHGFELESKLEKRLQDKDPGSPEKVEKWRAAPGEYNHNMAPDGIFIASGPAFGAGKVEGLSVFEILPLFLRLKGWPIARDLEGRVPSEVFDPGFLERHPLLWTDSYRGLQESSAPGGESGVDEQMIERLRALGYVN